MITFIPNRCQPWLYKKAECRLCVDACPVEGCISFNDGTIDIKTEDCIGCGICTTVCPTSALVMEGLTDRELLNRLKAALPKGCHCEPRNIGVKQSQVPNPQSEISLILGCTLGQKADEDSKNSKLRTMSLRGTLVPKQSQQSGIASPAARNDIALNSELFINLPCLAILKESHLISLILSGVNNVYFDTSHCEGCSFRYGRRTIEKTVSYACNLLETMGYYDCIKIVHSGQWSVVIENKKSIHSFGKNKKKNVKTITPGPEYSRRELLHFFREKAVEKLVPAEPAPYSLRGSKQAPDSFNQGQGEKRGDAGSGEGIPERRVLLLEAFKGRDFSSNIQIEYGRFPVHQPKIREDCSLCHGCSLFCPTGALRKVEGEEEVRIDFDMALCMGCYECSELCPEGAIQREEAIDLNPLFNRETKTLFKKTSIPCPSCSGRFFPEDGVEECRVCRKKKEQDDRAFESLFGQPWQ